MSVFCFVLAHQAQAQNTTSPLQFVLNMSTVAPHRPPMQRDTLGVHIFHGGLIKYKHHENKESLEAWLEHYPDEANLYISAIRTYISTHTNTMLSGVEAEIYCDLKSQWVMLAHILDLEVFQQ